MTRRDLHTRIRKLSESKNLALVGRVSAAVVAVIGAPLAVYAVTLLIRISGDVAVLKSEIATALADPYKGADAKRDFDRRDDAIQFATGSINELKTRVGTLEYISASRGAGRPRP
jgi:hypothetical protein